MLKKLEAVLERFKKYNVRINLEKSKFFVERVEFLGHVLSAKGNKIKAILKVLTPENKQ